MGEEKKAEIEWQFEIDDVKRAHKLLVNFLKRHHYRFKDKAAKTHVDTYFDTKDFIFHRANLSLRVRSKLRGFEACIKSFGEGNSAALKERTEIVERAQGSTIADVLSLSGKVGKRISYRHPHDSMHKLFSIKTQRQKVSILNGNKQVVEVALDTTKKASVGAGKPFSFSRLEFECLDEKEFPFAESLVEDIKKYFKKHRYKLEEAIASKYKTMLDKEGVTIPKVDFGSCDFSKTTDPHRYSNAILRKYLAHAASQEWGARIGLSNEFVHQMRVGFRKFRTALNVFKKYLPKEVKKHAESMSDLLDTLGVVRDLDVQIESAREWMEHAAPGEQDAIQEVITYFERKQHAAHAHLVKIFDAKEYAEIFDGFHKLLQEHDTNKQDKTDITKVAKELIKKQVKQFKRKGKILNVDSDGKDFHKFRIAGKKLRYTLEFFEPLNAEVIGKLMKRMAEIQDALGVINDCHVAKERLLGMMTTPQKKFSEPALYEIMKASRYYGSMETHFRTQIIDTYKQINWRDFKVSPHLTPRKE